VRSRSSRRNNNKVNSRRLHRPREPACFASAFSVRATMRSCSLIDSLRSTIVPLGSIVFYGSYMLQPSLSPYLSLYIQQSWFCPISWPTCTVFGHILPFPSSSNCNDVATIVIIPQERCYITAVWLQSSPPNAAVLQKPLSRQATGFESTAKFETFDRSFFSCDDE